MRPTGRASRELSASMALLAVAAAVCLSVPAGGAVLAGPLQQGQADRRVASEADEAVASFMACLNEAAKTLAGQTAAVFERDADDFTIDLPRLDEFSPRHDRPVVALQPHVSLLNLPPPATLS